MNEYQVMASNDLRSGRVIYLTANGWSPDFHAATPIEGDVALETAQKRAENAMSDNEVVDAYLVKVLGDSSQPMHIRERIRHSGPTCLPSAGQYAQTQSAG